MGLINNNRQIYLIDLSDFPGSINAIGHKHGVVFNRHWNYGKLGFRGMFRKSSSEILPLRLRSCLMIILVSTICLTILIKHQWYYDIRSSSKQKQLYNNSISYQITQGNIPISCISIRLVAVKIPFPQAISLRYEQC